MNKIVAIVGGAVGVGLAIYGAVIADKTAIAAEDAARKATVEARTRSAEEIAEIAKLDDIAPKAADILAKEKTEVNSILGETWVEADLADPTTKVMYDAQRASAEKYVRRQRTPEDAEIIDENNRLLKFKHSIEERERKIVRDALDKDSALIEVLRDEHISKWHLYVVGGVVTGGAGYALFCMWRKIIFLAKRI